MNRQYLLLVGVLLCVTFSTLRADGVNLVANPGFEAAALSPWQWRASGGAVGETKVDTQVVHSGKRSMRLSNKTPAAPEIFVVLQQNLPVKPHTTYRIGAWCKGRGVGSAFLGGGHHWMLREVLPVGDFDWRFISIDVTTHPKETQFDLILVVEDRAEALWVDDVQMVELGALQQTQVYSTRSSASVTALQRFYPALPADLKLPASVVEIKSGTGGPRAIFQARWDARELVCNIEVFDSTRNALDNPKGIWDGDQVWVALDTAPGRVMEGYDDRCAEIAFAVSGAAVAQPRVTAAGAKGLKIGAIRSSVEYNAAGYVLRLQIPWEIPDLNLAERLSVLGINLKVMDGNASKSAQWASGMTPRRNPGEFARLLLVDPDDARRADLRLSSDILDRGDWVTGTFTEFATEELNRAMWKLNAVSPAGETVELASAELVPSRPGSIRQVDFLMPADLLRSSGGWTLKAEVAGATTAESRVTRFDSVALAQELVPTTQQRLHELVGKIASLPQFQEDAYLQAAQWVARRFVDRVTGSGAQRQTASWTLLQLREVNEVLEQAETRLETLTKGVTSIAVASDIRSAEKIEIRDGILYPHGTTRPIYLVGSVGWGQFMEEYPPVGANYAHREVLPWTMNQDGSLNAEGQTVLDALAICQARGVKLDLLLAPHNFPSWAIDEAPALANIRPFGFLKYNIDHPVARRVIEQWLRTIVPKVKDSPALASICLSNEPQYVQSGRDEWSRPLWVGYLKKKYGDIKSLNSHYESQHSSFEQVPVPDPRMPQGKPQQRLYYDWCVFNQEHFAGWHGWMNGIIKSYVPEIPTHTKIMSNIWDQEMVCNGVNPELMTNVTDLAGNDAYAQWSPSGVYAYNWQLEQAWYDLLHSFGGKPVHNSENHLIFEGRMGTIPSQQTHAVLWQGALHHQAMTTMWVWGEADVGELRGNVSLRPGNLYASCRATIDLNRLAPQVAAISSQKARVAILHSFSTTFWEPKYKESVLKVYTALTFAGEQVRFVSERQLQEQIPPDVEYIIAPNTTHITDLAAAGLERFIAGGGKVLRAGRQCFERDDYDRARTLSPALAATSAIDLANDEETAGTAVIEALAGLGLKSATLIDTDTGSRAWGVEYRIVNDGENKLVSMINLLNRPLNVKLGFTGHTIDLLSSEAIDPQSVSLAPMTPRLMTIAAEQKAQ